MFFSGNASSVLNFIERTFYFFIALFPFIFYQGYLYYGTSSRSVNLIIIVELLAIVFGFALLSKERRINIAKSPITLSLAIFLVIIFVTGVLGVDFQSSFWSKATRTTGLFYFLHISLFYLFFFMLFSQENKLIKFLKVFLISAGVFSICSLLSRDGFNLIFTSKSWTGFTFGNSTFAGMYLYPAFLLSIYFVLSQPKEMRRWWKNMLPIVFIINPYFINRDVWLGKADLLQNPLSFFGEAQASSFTAFFSIIALLAIWLVSKIKNAIVRRRILLGSVIVGTAFAVFAMISFLSPNGYLREAYLSQASNARPLVWELSQNAINDRPLLGWGTDNFDRAFQSHFNNELLENKNGAEAWFDRAHNIFFDQTIETGYIGFIIYILVYISIIGSMLYVLFRSKERNDHPLAFIVIIYFVGHFMEVQTAFDTSISYVPLAIMASIGAILFHKIYKANKGEKSEWLVSRWLQYFFGTTLIVGSATLLFVGTIPIIRAEATNGSIRRAGSSEKRLAVYPVLFGSPLDSATFLWKTSTDLQRGIAADTTVLEDKNAIDGFKKELNLFVEEYDGYLSKNTLDYRSHLSLADIYIYERLFEVDHLNKAHEALDRAMAINPNIPQAYWMKSVTYLYQRKFDLAREWAKKGYDLNPGIEQSQEIVDYINRSIKTFPEIDLYHFWQI